MTSLLSAAPIGRPRAFEPQAALHAALQVFWLQGFEATSLGDLTAAMGLSRSSFYGTFGSKQAVLLASVQIYVDRIFTSLESCARSDTNPIKAARTMFNTMTGHAGDNKGCLFVNSVTELAPGNSDLAKLARRHLDRVIALFASTLIQARFPESTAKSRATALIACAFGATILRKAGLPRASIAAMLAQADTLLAPPTDGQVEPLTLKVNQPCRTKAKAKSR